ncbi:MAG: helix-hairpin-helix domain-containing protein, partial [Candidatus Hydrogenedentota bacterium]
ENDLPDLVLVDGGKGQLGVTTAVLKDLGIEDLHAAGIAKSRSQESGVASPERFFVPGRSNAIVPPQNSSMVHLLARIRDEAHRFAITYQRKKRKKGTLRTGLTDIQGVGPALAKKLLKQFGSIARIKDVSVEELSEVPGISASLAGAIRRHFTAK